MPTFDYSVICRNAEAETEKIACNIRGSFPTWLHGFLLYNGPGLTKIGSSEYKHAFDASALLQKFTFENGTVFYTSKFLQSDTYKKNKKANAITVAEFGTPGPASKGVLARLKNTMDSDKMMTDNAMLSVVKLGEKFYAIGEPPYYLQIDPDTLEVINRVNMNKAFSLVTQSCHVLRDEDDSYYTVAEAVGLTGPKYSILKFPKDGDIQKGKSIATVPCRWRLSPCYIHSVILTKNYLIIVEPPLAVSIMELLSDVIKNVPFIEGLHWHNESTLFHIIDRHTWTPLAIKYVSDPLFFLHFCQAFEQENHIVVDMCVYKDSAILQNMFISKLRSGADNGSSDMHETFCSTLKRFVIPLDVPKDREELVTLPDTQSKARRVKNEIKLEPEIMNGVPFENPVVNKIFSAKGNRFAWGMGPCPDRGNFNQIIKIDLKTRETNIFKEEGLYSVPHVFVAKPDSEKEDEGLIIALQLTSGKERLVTLLILDADSMEEVCRATIEIEATVPMPLHGHFFSG